MKPVGEPLGVLKILHCLLCGARDMILETCHISDYFSCDGCMLAATSSNHSIRLFSRQNLASTTTITGNTVMQVNRVYSESCLGNVKLSRLEVLF